MYRFYVNREKISGNMIEITGSDVNHIKNVLRLNAGDWIIACNGAGTDYVSRISEIKGDAISLTVEKVQDTDTELKCRVVLFQGIPKKDKMEFIIQKAVELGVNEIVPVVMSRCVVKLDEEKADKKRKRWQSISEAAAKQSGRGIIPSVNKPVSLFEAFDIAAGLEYNMIPYELQDGMTASRKIVDDACTKSSVGIFIGPEGGFEKSEIDEAVKRNIRPITLGKRILRTETAGIALLSVMMFQMQD